MRNLQAAEQFPIRPHSKRDPYWVRCTECRARIHKTSQGKLRAAAMQRWLSVKNGRRLKRSNNSDHKGCTEQPYGADAEQPEPSNTLPNHA